MTETNKRSLFRRERIAHIPLRLIAPNPAQPRRKFDIDELSSLAESIRENGVLQPITVRLVGRAYFLIAGERRLRAAHMAGLSEIPCIVVTADDKKAAVFALLENLQRADLGFFEEAEGLERLIRTYGFSQEDIAKKLGKSQSAVSNKLRLLRLGVDVMREIIDGGLSERHARALLRLNTHEERMDAVRYIRENELNVSRTDEYIERLLTRHDKKEEMPRMRQYVIKDVRLFYNTLNRAVDTMRRAGVRADFKKDEDEDEIRVSIKIFK